jgi:rhodanese-related sulfurtransferase
MQILQNNWPLLLIIAWFGYKWFRSQQVAKMLPQLKNQGAQLVDVRSQSEFMSAHAPGTMNIPLQELNSRLHEIDKNKPIVLCCASGSRSGMAAMMLKKNGFKQVYNIGTWSKLA